MLSGVRSHLAGFERALAAPFVRLRVPPTAITLFTLFPAAAAAALVANRDWLPALGLGIVASLLDMVDGAVARQTGRVTAFGGFLDSVVDRVTDLLFLFGLGFALDSQRGWILVGSAVLGSYLTSYSRARAYEALYVPRSAWNELFERPERVLLLGLGALVQAVLDWRDTAPADFPLLAIEATLALYAALSLLTVLQRVVKVRRLVAGTPPRGPQ